MTPDLDVAIIGAGPKGISLMCTLRSSGSADVVAFEAGQPVGTWDSSLAGTSSTRTGMYFSDTIVPGHSSVPPLATYATSHPLMDPDRIAADDMPKEVLQDYFREVIAADTLDVHTHTTVARIALDRGVFRLYGEGFETSARVVVDATGVVWS
ncbi:MAG: NAD(P)-binding domain-containing protein, partial [Actinomycetota bacterium]|nr:NAD(P)-binding domain-containing protein [Actinomycetota bacterium]